VDPIAATAGSIALLAAELGLSRSTAWRRLKVSWRPNPSTHGVRRFADRPDSRAIRPHAPWSLYDGLAVGSQHGMWSHRRRSRDLASDGDRPAAHLALDDPIMIHVGNIGTRAEVITVPRANPRIGYTSCQLIRER
jgi:hypothetical protein